MSELREEFERQAEWRRGKADQHPDDTRNLEAANLFDKLASTVATCPQEVVDAARKQFEDFGDSETWQQMIKEVGFHYWPTSAEKFCRDFIVRRTA